MRVLPASGWRRDFALLWLGLGVGIAFTAKNWVLVLLVPELLFHLVPMALDPTALSGRIVAGVVLGAVYAALLLGGVALIREGNRIGRRAFGGDD